MKFLNHPKFKYLVLLPIVLLIINAMACYVDMQDIQDTMVRQKLQEVTDEVDIISYMINDMNIELCQDCGECEHCNVSKVAVLAGVSHIDNMYYVYSAAFSQEEHGLELVSKRNDQTDFNPLLYNEFLSIIFEADTGNVRLTVTPTGEETREVFLYFKWIPLDKQGVEKYLVTAGVSYYSLVTKIPAWIFIREIIIMSITFTLEIIGVLLLCYLGHIYEQRKTEKGTRWRCKR